MPKLRSASSTEGRNLAAASALWRAKGMTGKDLGKSMGEVIDEWDISDEELNARRENKPNSVDKGAVRNAAMQEDE